MKKNVIMAALICALSVLAVGCKHGDGEVTIHLPADYAGKTLVVSHVTIDNIFNAKQQEDLKIIYDTLEVKDGVAHLRLDAQGPARYEIEAPADALQSPDFYAAPDESLEITITSFNPLKYKATGTLLMEDMTALSAITAPIQQSYVEMVNSGRQVTQEEAKAVMDKYDAAIKKFVADNPESPLVPFAILDLSGEDFKERFDKLSESAKKSILMPYAVLYNRQVEEMLQERKAEEARHAEVASGTITAPDFTLPDLAGKKVSLSDFKGKWVVLDFWGSWCGWCVKGFPALKEAYRKYGDKIVVIGIDCNESEADWRAGVKAHDLPWMNLYNGNDDALYEAYHIEGFPTKAIINPDGKLVDLTTGEDPAFFTRLAGFVK